MLFQIYSVLGTCGEFAMLVSSIIQRDALPDEIVAKLMQPELPRAIAARRKDFATKCSQVTALIDGLLPGGLARPLPADPSNRAVRRS